MNWIKAIFNKKGLQDDWFRLNQPTGKRLGYPDCCIRAFGNDPPILLKIEVFKGNRPNREDYIRYNAGCLNGEFTGFIPCADHAKQIISGKINLPSLITNREKELPPFPMA